MRLIATSPQLRTAQQRLVAYAQLMRLDRPVGIYLLLWPTLWALWFAARGVPDPNLLLTFTAGVVLMRSAGCVINDFADRHFDGHVARTQHRPLPRGSVRPSEALILFGGLCLAAFILVVWQTNDLTIALSFGGAGLAALYPFMKRFTHLPQLFLGAAFAWAIPMAFTAQTGGLPAQAWLLYTGTLLWTVAYDTQYAMVDREDDLKIGIKSTAILFGDADKAAIGMLQGLSLLVLFLLGNQVGLGQAYHLSLVAVACLFIYQQHLIRLREPARCFQAFLNNQYVGLAIFLGLVADFAGWLD